MKQQTLRQARERRHLTITALAELSGINKATLSRLESGDTANPSHNTVTLLEAALRVRRGSLVFGASAAGVEASVVHVAEVTAR